MARGLLGFFQVTEQSGSGWRWQLRTDAGQVIAESPTVATVEDCLKSLKWLRTNIQNLPIVDAAGDPIAS